MIGFKKFTFLRRQNPKIQIQWFDKTKQKSWIWKLIGYSHCILVFRFVRPTCRDVHRFWERTKFCVIYVVIQKKNNGRTNWIARSLNCLFLCFLIKRKNTKTNNLKSLQRTKEQFLRKTKFFFEQLKKEQNGSDEERLTSVIIKKQICNENVYVMYIKSLNGN